MLALIDGLNSPIYSILCFMWRGVYGGSYPKKKGREEKGKSGVPAKKKM